jgi:uncharacterized protein (DUF952 family)
MSEVDLSTVFKLTTLDEWSCAVVEGAFAGSPDDHRDGFIHLSAHHQLEGTAAKYFGGIEGLCLVAFAADDLAAGLRWEPSRGGENFPHFYGALPATAALWVRPVPLDEEGAPLIGEVFWDEEPAAS